MEGKCDEEGEKGARGVERSAQEERLSYLLLMKTGCLLLQGCNDSVDCFVFVVIFHHQREGGRCRREDGEVRWSTTRKKNNKVS